MSLIEDYFSYLNMVRDINRKRKMPSYIKCVCILSYRNKYTLLGINKKKTHPLMIEYGYPIDHNYPMHAEFDAFIKAKNIGFEFDTMYIYRGHDGLLPSRPCIICSSWIKEELDKVNIVFFDGNKVVTGLSNFLKGHIKSKNLI